MHVRATPPIAPDYTMHADASDMAELFAVMALVRRRSVPAAEVDERVVVAIERWCVG